MIEWSTQGVPTMPSDALPPYISSITPISPSGTQNIEIVGEYFSPLSSLSIPGVTVATMTVKSPYLITATINKSGLSGTIPISIKNGNNSNNLWSDSIKSVIINPDPYWANVILFLKGDGINNSTNIVDSSPNPKIITRVGDTKISTAQSKYGNSSIYFDGSGDLLQINHADFNFAGNNFTVEFWIYPLTSAYFIGKGDASTVSGSMFSFVPQYGCTTYYNGGSSISLTISFNLNVWQHIAIVRNGSSYKLYKNGVLLLSLIHI